MIARLPAARSVAYWLGAAAVGLGVALSAGHAVASADSSSAGVADATATHAGARQERGASALRTRDAERPRPLRTRRSAADPSSTDGSDVRSPRQWAAATRSDTDDRPTASRSRPIRALVESRAAARRSPAMPGPAEPDARTTTNRPVAPSADAVSGVRTGRSVLDIPIGARGYRTSADWYFPTRADGSVAATGVIYLQHGFAGRNFFYSALAEALSQRTNSIVVAPNLPSYPQLRCGGCWINSTAAQQGVAELFVGDEAALNASAAAAGFAGTLPQQFVHTGHSAGGGLVTAAAGYYAGTPDNGGNLRGVVMFDGVAFSAVLPAALPRLADPFVPVYTIAAPPQFANSFGTTTKDLVAARPGRFVGVTLARGSHVDSLIGGSVIVDVLAQLVTRFSPPGNTAAVYTLASGWIDDLYRGLGPEDGTGIYGDPGQSLMLGDATAAVLGAPTTGRS